MSSKEPCRFPIRTPIQTQRVFVPDVSRRLEEDQELVRRKYHLAEVVPCENLSMPENCKETERNCKKIRFDVFEVDFEQRELRRSGVRLRLQRQPFRILELLLENQGSLVTREELARHLWPGLHVCFDRGLNTAVNALRHVLGDSSRKPRFIETRPGLGYRFIAPVEVIETSSSLKNSAGNQGKPAAGERLDNLRKYAAKLDAYQDYLKGRFFLSKMHAEGILKAIAHFEAAIAEDANCAPAYAGLADCYCDLALLSSAPVDNYATRARALSSGAQDLDPELAETHVALARVKMLFDFDWEAAQSICLRALDLAQDHADAHRVLALHSSILGNHESALRIAGRARTLEPLSLPINAEIAWHLFIARDFERAAEQCWKVLTMEPMFSPAQHTLGLAYEQLGMHQEALTELKNADSCFGHHEAALSALGHAYAKAGMRHEALNSLHDLEDLSRKKHASPYWQSLVYAGLGDHSSALAAIDRAYQSRDVALLWLNVDPRLDALRGDARFQRILREMNFSAEACTAALA